ncbi:hypothetical protein [Paenibacillus radicis (ex Gao et al. 2016)]|uniref:Uncharacterized protein n=1 Tax=Paenibacillus radicis (ex Gao et al. 2016) TaxID=1737354 RepID=A0A917HEW0_9BACL|nr:hypothetical protein [Paenibacillus radicis (ex Gao et al. 2016)]GGG76341.1 hypothetical protein GCM10010918_36060 [Paenibacillus radicis (ex Gao et al. 2016)]
MIPFERSWPYDIVMNDVYVPSCPFCGADNVLIPLRVKEIADIQHGKKKLLVFPCCHNKATIVDMDNDYLLADQALRTIRS